jgi:hypothetical protein
LDGSEHITPAGEPDGDDQDQRGGADDHAQGSERKTNLIEAERIDGQEHDLAERDALSLAI